MKSGKTLKAEKAREALIGVFKPFTSQLLNARQLLTGRGQHHISTPHRLTLISSYSDVLRGVDLYLSKDFSLCE